MHMLPSAGGPGLAPAMDDGPLQAQPLDISFDGRGGRMIGLGFMLAPTFPPGVGPRTFGHSGAGGSVAFADPDRGLSFGYVMSQMKMAMEPDPRSAGLVKAAYEALA